MEILWGKYFDTVILTNDAFANRTIGAFEWTEKKTENPKYCMDDSRRFMKGE